ncbi:MAG: hypothetical protein GX815_14770, partial [Clostridiales bacterium]|nr:hypothetical protein [Clostridiales bacterium]
CPGVSKSVSHHPDTTCRHIGGRDFFIFSGSVRQKWAESLGANISSVPPPAAERYPFEAALNACLIGKFALFSERTVVPSLRAALAAKGYEIVPVNQGYAACSVAVADEGTGITADPGIAAALEQRGVEVLRISPGHIPLACHEYGCICGAFGKGAPDLALFTCRLDTHPDGERILSFLAGRGIAARYLTSGPAFDAGGLVPVTETPCRGGNHITRKSIY